MWHDYPSFERIFPVFTVWADWLRQLGKGGHWQLIKQAAGCWIVNIKITTSIDLLIQKIKWFQFKTAVKDWSFSRAASLNASRKIGLQLNCLDQLWFATQSLQCKPKSRQVLTLVLNAVYRHTALSLYFCILVTFRPKFALTPNSETGIKEAAMLRYDKKCYFNVRSKADISQLNLPHGTHTHTHPFNGPFSGTNRVCRYQKGKTNLDFTEARDSEWQWHQLGHMQVYNSLQTDNHASTPPLSFLQAGCPSCC